MLSTFQITFLNHKLDIYLFERLFKYEFLNMRFLTNINLFNVYCMVVSRNQFLFEWNSIRFLYLFIYLFNFNERNERDSVVSSI